MLTPVALAHMIMGDDAVRPHGLILCTNNYSIQDVVLLMNVLQIRYRLDCTLHLKRQNKIEYLIYIRQCYMPSLLNIVSPYMHSSMLYKLNNSLSNPSNLSKPSNRKKISVLDQVENQTIIYNSIRVAAIRLKY